MKSRRAERDNANDSNDTRCMVRQSRQFDMKINLTLGCNSKMNASGKDGVGQSDTTISSTRLAGGCNALIATIRLSIHFFLVAYTRIETVHPDRERSQGKKFEQTSHLLRLTSGEEARAGNPDANLGSPGRCKGWKHDCSPTKWYELRPRSLPGPLAPRRFVGYLGGSS